MGPEPGAPPPPRPAPRSVLDDLPDLQRLTGLFAARAWLPHGPRRASASPSVYQRTRWSVMGLPPVLLDPGVLLEV